MLKCCLSLFPLNYVDKGFVMIHEDVLVCWGCMLSCPDVEVYMLSQRLP